LNLGLVDILIRWHKIQIFGQLKFILCAIEIREFLIHIWIAIYVIVLVWSGINPKDQFTWFLEVAPAIIGAIVLLITYKSFKLTNLVYALILVHCIILMVGGHYTYAEVPLFDYFKEVSGSIRNNYDKVGHFAQGFIPAMVAREIILRKEIIRGSAWQFFFIVTFCLSFSAFYELIEWWVALATGESAEAFLGTQGYVWDTQSDMAFALLGAVTALVTLKKQHDNQLSKISTHNKSNQTLGAR
jgi:putative membrane protein